MGVFRQLDRRMDQSAFIKRGLISQWSSLGSVTIIKLNPVPPGIPSILKTLAWRSFALALAARVFLASADATSLNLQVSSETAPPGRWVQIKVFASAPASISSASISMDLDPAAFANITRVMAFSASGDAIGYAEVSALHVNVHVSSPSGSIGITPDVPILAIWADLFVGAEPGSVASLSLNPSSAILMDSMRNEYTNTITAGQLPVGRTTSIQNVVPCGGTVGPRTILRITGSGFSAPTTFPVDGHNLA